MLSSCRRFHEAKSIIWTSVFFLLILIAYIGTSNFLVWGDTVASRYLPISVIRELNLDLDEFTLPYDKEVPYFLQYRNGRLVSSYPVGAALTAVPFYLIPVLIGVSHGSLWIPLVEKISASSITLMSAFFLYLSLKQLTTQRTSIVVTGIYALCTSAFSISSQALWQHGPSQFFLALGLYFLIRGLREESFVPWSGFPLSASIVCRPTDVLMVVPVLAYICLYRRKFLLWWLLCALPPALFLFGYNYMYFGAIFDSGYGTKVLQPNSTHWSGPFLYGFLGILVSPSKGLLTYSPVLLFAFWGIYLTWRKNHDPLLKFISLGPILVLVLYGKWHFWWGGETYGPRLISDITPFLCLYLYLAWEFVEQKWVLKVLFISVTVISLLIHAIGAFTFDASWYQKGDVPVESDRLWSVGGSPIVHYGQRLFYKNLSFVRTALSSHPTSSREPHQLAATFSHYGLPRHHESGQSIRLSIIVSNTGPAIWLFQTNNGQHGVRLGWRWFGTEGEVPHSEGRIPLARDVFPGEQEQLNLEIWPPSVEGSYVLELGLISEPSTWFAVHRETVQIVGSCYFEEVTNQQVKSIAESPNITITPDKPSYQSEKISNIRLSVSNGDIARNLRLSVFLRHPDGHLRSLNSAAEMPPNPPCNQWIRMATPQILSRQFKLEWELGLRLENTPDGNYTLYALMTELGSVKVISKSSSTFYLSHDYLNDLPRSLGKSSL
jgi:hypothetical protein